MSAAAVLVLAFAAAARAQTLSGRAAVAPLPPAAAAAPLHGALLAPDGAAGAPLASLLSAGAARISAAPAAAPVLAALAAGEPAERAAAALLARALSDTRDASALLLRMPDLIYGDLPRLAGRRLPLGAAAALAERARRDPSLAYLFDGRPAPSVGVPDGAALDGEDLFAGGRRIPALGRGAFGVVHPHPDVEGAVVKTDLPRGPASLDGPPGLAEWRVERDAATAREAARIGAGPRVLGFGSVGGRPALVKERVYGRSVHALLEAGDFGPEDHALLEDLFLRIARSGISFFDARPENVMIGRTLANPARRAYLVDGGEVVAPKPGASPVDAMERLFGVLRQLTHDPGLLARFDAVHFARPLPRE